MKRKLLYLEAGLVLAPFVALAIVWHRFPTRFPVHWNLQGEIDRWSSNRAEILVLPFTTLGIILLLHIIPRLDPKLRATLGQNGRMGPAMRIICVALAVLLDLLFANQLTAAFGYQMVSAAVVTAALLIVFAIMGNYLGNLRPNYFIGIRTPWTLEDAGTWRATHRIGGRLMFGGSLALLLLQFFLNQGVIIILLASSTLLFCLWAVLYSWHHFRKFHAVRAPTDVL